MYGVNYCHKDSTAIKTVYHLCCVKGKGRTAQKCSEIREDCYATSGEPEAPRACCSWRSSATPCPLILGDALGWIAVGTDAYTLLGGLVTILGAWAGGPRAMQYLGPQVGAVLSRVGGGRRGYSGPEVSVRVGDNPATDDERG